MEKLHVTNKKENNCKRYHEVSQLAVDREGWRAAVNQSKD
jgi:hypothetical protein